jgi:hypothetical protein
MAQPAQQPDLLVIGAALKVLATPANGQTLATLGNEAPHLVNFPVLQQAPAIQ